MASNHQKQYIQSRFNAESIEIYGWMFGSNWQSMGGEQTTRDFVSKLCLKPGDRVLDVGCGTGGSAIFMARYYGVYVHGVDVSTHMIQGALQEKEKLEENIKQKVTFEVCDILTADLEEGSYNIIFSKDVFNYLKEKDKLFTKLYNLLKPSGTLFFSDYCSTPQATQGFLRDIFSKRSYYLETLESYVGMMRRAGFQEDLQAEDLFQYFLDINQRLMRSFNSMREAFVATFSQDDFDHLKREQICQMTWIEEGQLTWGAFTAKK